MYKIKEIDSKLAVVGPTPPQTDEEKEEFLRLYDLAFNANYLVAVSEIKKILSNSTNSPEKQKLLKDELLKFAVIKTAFENNKKNYIKEKVGIEL